MATPVITQTTQTYQGIPIVCARIVCTEACSYKFQGVVNAPDDYLFQLVVRASAARTLTITCGGSVDTLDITTTFDRYVMAFPDVAVADNDSLYIDFPAGTYYLYNLQLERGTNATKWQPAPEDAAAYSDKAAAAAVDAQTQRDIFNRLTNNGAVQGLTLLNGQLYINASYIQSGTLVLGGVNNGNGTLKVVDANGNTVGTWTNTGINLLSGTIGGWTIGQNEIYKNEYAVGTIEAKVGLMSSFGDVMAYTDYYDYGSETNFIRAALRYGSVELYRKQDGTLWDSGRMQTSSAIYAALDNRPYLSFTANRCMKLYGNSDNFLHYHYSSTGATMPAGLPLESRKLYLLPPNGVEVRSSFTVTGTKSREVDTDDYGKRLLYCYEMPSPMFGDVGEGEIGEDGLAYIWLDSIFAQTITTGNYQVFLQKYGDGSAFVKERRADHFVVQGTPGLSFGWELKAKQSDFDQLRLEKDDGQFVPPESDLGEQAAEYITTLKDGRISA